MNIGLETKGSTEKKRLKPPRTPRGLVYGFHGLDRLRQGTVNSEEELRVESLEKEWKGKVI